MRNYYTDKATAITRVENYERMSHSVFLNPIDAALLFTYAVKSHLAELSFVIFQIDRLLVPEDYLDEFKLLCRNLRIHLYSESDVERLNKMTREKKQRGG